MLELRSLFLRQDFCGCLEGVWQRFIVNRLPAGMGWGITEVKIAEG